MKAAYRIIQYIKGSPRLGLFLSSTSKLHLKAYCNADWAGCLNTRRSLTGYCVYLGDPLISWRSKKQGTVSRSSAEAKYHFIATTTCGLVWLLQLLKDLNVNHSKPALLYYDNQAAIHIAADPVFHGHSKHIKIDCHLIWEKIQERKIQNFSYF